MSKQTKPNYTEMKEKFNAVATPLSETQLMESLRAFKTEDKAKQWLISHLNDRQRYFVSMVDAFTTKGWKHFYGQPLYLKFLELYSQNILFLVDCSPLSIRETKTFKEQIVDLMASCQGVSETPKPKVSPRKPKASKPKVSQSKPKVVPSKPKASKPTVSKPKVSDDKLTKLTESVCLLANQVAKLTELVTRTSLEVAEIKASKVEPKVVQPKAVSKPKVIDEKVIVRDKKTNTKVVVSKEIKPKATPTKSLWEQIFTQTTKVDHKLAFGHSSDVDCGKRKKALMEVK
jgi:hypothetical protein